MPSDSPPLPLIVLAGHDPRPGAMPENGGRLHPLVGAKSLTLKIDGRPLIDLLLDRLVDSGLFAPIYLAGPVSAFGPRRGKAEVIDTSGSFGRNIRTALETARKRHPASAVAVATCDILPEVEELRELMADYHAHAPLDFWFPLIRAPREKGKLGASAWKPQYRMVAEGSDEPVSNLPGHLLVIDPEALRRPLVYRSFNLAYQSRNRPIMYRLWLILRGVVGGLLLQDLKNLLSLRLPTFTATVVFHGIALARHLRDGIITQEELEKRCRGIYISHRHRRRFPGRRGRLPLMRALSLAKDIDTREEADEVTRALSHDP